MDLETLFLLTMLGLLARLIHLVLGLKNFVKVEVKESYSKVQLVENSSNVKSIMQTRTAAALKRCGLLLMQGEALERMFEHADESEIQRYEIQFRFERRLILKGLQELKILDLQKERANFIKKMDGRR
ncbi:hypothetical protein L1D50_16535 [Pseudoalteromonas sp. Isolate6]|uniref:hypothetical protein n=1 Tax=Pseudoalteromonas sp. Isolate6 TaxID=2908527 RepID=UPI001EFEB1F3|nr:hypothetical protein [Pseudoalteromonas sp. Isolate6]MCG9760711.1 hypothetical protein [Pseudoalteromonas sp. Isolate6]